MEVPFRQIRARFDERTVTVYQAYRPGIAAPAARDGHFPADFKRERMTWIKPSFLWMMYRSGWATKPGQEHVLAITITRTGFEWALNNSAFSHFDANKHDSHEEWKSSLTAPVRIQWDPERDIRLAPLPHRSIQIGLAGDASRQYCDKWITNIEDITELTHETAELVRTGNLDQARKLLPTEHPYPIHNALATHLGMN
ncbi:hypothetical protein NONO_c66060 [Nocardia nova SH22a]|uniref:DUF4291 domain-containing protein n=1 Tax=Nocardia nova SH22a TaxID=1415166 RepID=W5TW42_9NOCA|nr:DUF4291 domain-containing protein [Nocardia nova]AHH21376.1 hypothetical protein NONO_c66060 [Nocardia nova SH22a]